MAYNPNPEAAPNANTDTGLGDLARQLAERGVVVGEQQKAEQQAAAKEKEASADDADLVRVDRSAEFNIDNNPFWQTLKNPDLTTDQKKQEIAKMMTYDVNLEIDENEARQRHFEIFKAYMMDWRKNMALDMIELTNKDTYAELSKMYNQISTEMLRYQNSLQPLLDIINAVKLLRDKGEDMMLNVYKSFAEDAKLKAEYDQKLGAAEAVLKRSMLEDDVMTKQEIVLKNKKTMFRHRIKDSAQRDLDLLKIEQDKKKQEIATNFNVLKELKDNPFKEQFSDVKAAKDKVKELVDISTAEHRQRIVDLIDSAKKFVITTDVRGKAVLDNYIQGRNHIGTLETANRNLADIYAMLNGATNIALEKNDEILQRYNNPPMKLDAEGKLEVDADGKPVPDEEDFSDKLDRERTRDGIAAYIKVAVRSKADTVTVNGELETQKLTLQTRKDTNEDQIASAYSLIGTTNASIAENLATALEAVTSAANDQARLIAEDTAKVMQKTNDGVIQNVIEGMSENIKKQAVKLTEAGERLEWLTKMASDAQKTVSENQSRVTSATSTLEELGKRLKEQVSDLGSAAADAQSDAFNRASSVINASKPAAPVANDDAPAAPKTPAEKVAANPLTDLRLGEPIRSKRTPKQQP